MGSGITVGWRPGLGSSEDSTGLGTKEGFFIHMLGASNGVAEGTEPG